MSSGLSAWCRLALLICCGWVASCGNDAAPASARTQPRDGRLASTSDPSRAIYQRLLPAVGAEAHALTWDAEASDAERTWWVRDDLDGTLEPRWCTTRGERGPRMPLDAAWSRTEFGVETSAARAHLVRLLPAVPGLSYRLRVRGRTPQGGTLTAVVSPLTAALDLPTTLETQHLLDVLRVHGTRARQPLRARLPETRAWSETTLDFQAPYDAKCLLLSLIAETDDGVVEVDSVSLEGIPARVSLGLGRHDGPAWAKAGTAGVHEPLEGMPAALARRVNVDSEHRDALLLAAPARVSFDILVPDRPVQLSFGVARLREERKEWGQVPVRLLLEAELDGRRSTLWSAELATGSDAIGWDDQHVSLAAFADGELRLHWTAEAAGCNDLVAIGSPTIRERGSSDPRPHVVLVSLDTLRADRLGVHGYPRETSPNLDRLARESVWFRRAMSTAPYTLPSHASMMTGQLPPVHGVETSADRLSSVRSDLLAMRLADEGYATAGFTGGVYVSPEFGFDQGFDRYNDVDCLLTDDDTRWSVHPRRGDEAFNRRVHDQFGLDHVLGWIDEHHDAPFFLFLHTYLVHNYRPTPESRDRFYDVRNATVGASLRWPRRRASPEETLSEADRRHYSQLYDATVADADAAVGRLVDHLRALELWDRTIFVVTSDHGEEFGEHGGMGHGHTLYEEQVHIPWILRVPGQAAGVPVDRLVSLVDLTPTLLELLGLEPRRPMQGQSRVGLWTGRESTDVRAAWAGRRRERTLDELAYREGSMKLLVRQADDGSFSEARLFDLASDPGEQRPLDAPLDAARLEDALRKWDVELDSVGNALDGVGSRRLTPEMRAQLEQLGYLETGRDGDS